MRTKKAFISAYIIILNATKRRNKMRGDHMRSRSLVTKERIKTYVEKFYLNNHRSPSSREVAEALNMVKSTVNRYLLAMHEEGMIEYDHGDVKTETIEKVNTDIISMGVVGRVSCGPLELTEEYVEEYIPLPATLFGKGDFFILKACGNSMIDAGINDGDMVIVRKQETADDGQIVVALVENETTMKRLYRDDANHQVILHPENKSMEDIVVADCRIQGVAVHVLKSLE